MDDRDISGEDIAPEDANDVIQDITYVAILKDFGEKDMTIEKPAGYDPSIFYCTCKNDLCSNPDSGTVLWEKHQMITYGKLPNNKYMINWPINGNDYYVNMIEMDKEQRDSALLRSSIVETEVPHSGEDGRTRAAARRRRWERAATAS